MSEHSSLELDRAAMRRMGSQVVELVANHLATLRDQPVVTNDIPQEIRQKIAAHPAEEPGEFPHLLERLRNEVLNYTGAPLHPGFMGYVPSSPTFPAMLGDWIAAGWNIFAGVWSLAEGPNAVELAVLDWFRQWIGMPEGTSGLLTSGGSSATLTAIVAARHAAVGDDPGRLPRLTLYTSDQAHSAVLRAAWSAGIPRQNIRVLATDSRYRMIPSEVAEAIEADRAAGMIPVAVAASAGTTNTGAVDPLAELADLCHSLGVWFHVDAAYGGFATLTPEGKALLQGIGQADTVALDPHKWLYVPYECGCLLARDPARLRAAYQIMPDYLLDVAPSEAQVNFSDYGEQLTRQSHALKVWLGVHFAGMAALRHEIASGIHRAEVLEELIRQEPLLEILAPAQLGVVCFRVHPDGMDDQADLDSFNQQVNLAVNADGRFLISSTRLRGTFSLRACVFGFRTRDTDVAGMLESVVEQAQDLLIQSGHTRGGSYPR